MKGIDYVYLTLSFLGLLRVVLVIEPSAPEFTVASVLMIAIGVALRITKTTIEIKKWEGIPAVQVGPLNAPGQAA